MGKVAISKCSTLLSPSLGEGATPQHLRAYNMSIVFRYILRGAGKWSRADIAAQTGITRATISRLVDELVGFGLVEEERVSAVTSRGRPATMLSPKLGKVVAIGSEVTLSGLSLYAVDLAGHVVSTMSHNQNYTGWTPAEIFSELCILLHKMHDEVVSDDTLYLGCGIALPAVVDKEERVTSYDMDWYGLARGNLLDPVYDIGPMLVGNSGNMAAYAISQPTPGVLSGPDAFIYLSASDIVTGGIVLNSQVFGGKNGRGVALSHLGANLTYGKKCKCGANGCLACYLPRAQILEGAGLPQDVDLQEVLKSAQGGSEPAKQTLEIVGRVLGSVLGNLANVFDIPDAIIAGEITGLWPFIEPFIREELDARLQYIKPEDFTIDLIEREDGHAARGIAHRVLAELAANPAFWLDNPDYDFRGVVHWAGP